MKRALCVLAALAGGCGASGYTIIDRSSVVVSDNSRTTAHDVIPVYKDHPALVEHMALAQELYQKQLNLLKERRNKVRARRRNLSFASFGILSATGLSAGAAALSSANASPGSSRDALLGAGYTALAGLGLGVVLQIAGLVQEDYGNVDDKIRHLQSLYDGMLQRVHLLTNTTPFNEAEVGAAIEGFINDALQINVKG